MKKVLSIMAVATAALLLSACSGSKYAYPEYEEEGTPVSWTGGFNNTKTVLVHWDADWRISDKSDNWFSYQREGDYITINCEPNVSDIEREGYVALQSGDDVHYYYFSQSGISAEYVDLGLPSGTLWKSVNEPGYYTYEQAMGSFSNLPTQYQMEELINYCTWEKLYGGYLGRTNYGAIFFPSDGCYSYIDYAVDRRGDWGYYWTSTYYDMEHAMCMVYFMRDNKGPVTFNSTRNIGLSVRLVNNY